MDVCSYANGKELSVRYGRTEQLRSAIRHCQSSVAHVDFEVMLLQEKFDQAEIEIDKLNSIIDELRDENERLKREAKGGDA